MRRQRAEVGRTLAGDKLVDCSMFKATRATRTIWAWLLEPESDEATRLITRVRSCCRLASPSIAFSVLAELAHVWMMCKMLLDLRERVETPERSGGTDGWR